MTASSAIDLLKIHPNTAALFYKKIRQVIASHLAHDAQELFDGIVELDESYFSGVYKDNRGKRFAGKIIVFGLLKRQGKVYTGVVPATKAKTLMLIIIFSNIKPDSLVYTDSLRSYNVLEVG